MYDSYRFEPNFLRSCASFCRRLTKLSAWTVIFSSWVIQNQTRVGNIYKQQKAKYFLPTSPWVIILLPSYIHSLRYTILIVELSFALMVTSTLNRGDRPMTTSFLIVKKIKNKNKKNKSPFQDSPKISPTAVMLMYICSKVAELKEKKLNKKRTKNGKNKYLQLTL